VKVKRNFAHNGITSDFMCSTDHGMRLRIKVGLNQSRTWSTTTVSVHNQHIKRKKWHLHGVKTGGHSLIRDPHSGKWRVLWPPGPPQDRRHWLKTSSVICSRPNSSVGTQSFFSTFETILALWRWLHQQQMRRTVRDTGGPVSIFAVSRPCCSQPSHFQSRFGVAFIHKNRKST